MAADALRWYAEHSPLTDPGPDRAPAFAALPRGVAAGVQIVQGLVIQPAPNDPAPWTDNRHLRFVADMLAHIAERDGRPLTVAREPAERLRGNCRNSAVLLVALLRHQRVPARKRAGFARLAWRRCRSGAADPYEFERAGRGAGMAGVRQALLQDLDGLNRMELCSHDWWGGELDEKPDGELTPADRALLDRAADVTLSADADPAEARLLFERWGRDRAIRARLARAARP